MPTPPFFSPEPRWLGASLSSLWVALIVSAGASLCGCASSGAAGQDAPVYAGEITYTNSARGRSLGLVSVSMLLEMGVPGETPGERTLAFNSNKDTSAATKVCSDEVMKGVVAFLDSEGFAEYAISGPPNLTDGKLDGVLQIKLNGETRYMLNSDDTETEPEPKIAFAKLLNLFAQIYGEVRQYKAVEGQREFKKAEISSKLRGQSQPSSLFQGGVR